MLFHILELLVTSCANQGTRSCSRTPPASPTRFGWRTVFASGMHKVVSHLSVSCCQLSVWDVSVICQLLWTCQSFELVNSFGLVVVVTLGLSRCRHRSAGGPKPEPKQLFVWEVKRRSDEWQHQRVTKSNDLVCSWASGSGLLLCSCSALQGGVQPVDQTICSSRFMFDTWAFAGICQVVCWSAHNSAVKTWLDWLIPLQCKWTCFDIVFIIFIIFDSKRLHSIGHVSPRQLLMLGCQLCSQMQSVVSLSPFFHACFRCSLSKTQFTRKMKVSVSCKLSFGLLRSGGTSICAAEPCPAPSLTL